MMNAWPTLILVGVMQSLLGNGAWAMSSPCYCSQTMESL